MSLYGSRNRHFSGFVDIVTRQWGGVSNPPGLQAATRHGARDPLVRSQVDVRYLNRANLMILPKIFKERNEPYTGPVLLRQGEPGPSQYVYVIAMKISQFKCIKDHVTINPSRNDLNTVHSRLNLKGIRW